MRWARRTWSTKSLREQTVHILMCIRTWQILMAASLCAAQIRHWAHDGNNWKRLQHTLIHRAWFRVACPAIIQHAEKAMTTEIAEPPPSTSSELSSEKLDGDGFVVLRGSAFGQRFEDFVRKGLPFKSADGLDFCRATALDDIVSKHYTLDLHRLIWKIACTWCSWVCIFMVWTWSVHNAGCYSASPWILSSPAWTRARSPCDSFMEQRIKSCTLQRLSSLPVIEVYGRRYTIGGIYRSASNGGRGGRIRGRRIVILSLGAL